MVMVVCPQHWYCQLSPQPVVAVAVARWSVGGSLVSDVFDRWFSSEEKAEFLYTSRVEAYVQ